LRRQAGRPRGVLAECDKTSQRVPKRSEALIIRRVETRGIPNRSISHHNFLLELDRDTI
jgi:hypothetical protein